MQINVPFYFTKEGQGWQNSSVDVTLVYTNGTTQTTSKLTSTHLAQGNFTIREAPAFGYYVVRDDEKVRITNLVGWQNGSFLKFCPHCRQVKPVDAFDYSGRFTDEQRDQSNCSDCRGSY